MDEKWVALSPPRKGRRPLFMTGYGQRGGSQVTYTEDFIKYTCPRSLTQLGAAGKSWGMQKATEEKGWWQTTCQVLAES